ncbi:GGDEF and EAL domain-containing protein [Planococcus sp. PAMC 21323]|uniref:putative bifunctional diguanylate cyclase/phosphodiesterase n=1 Tax=Planococcus sp. PAMC 21323 TaxID=1526927 RepID=UPI0005861D68|nr:EAL domain-containing protein [Planococcus sp. PAMC 21323]AIY06766.1 GGDEF and EAL domain-containing protein [Planococcus sp. PAMC 21323]
MKLSKLKKWFAFYIFIHISFYYYFVLSAGSNDRGYLMAANFFSWLAPTIACVVLFYIYRKTKVQSRLFWLFFALGCFNYSIAESIWFYTDSILQEEVPYPGWADFFYFLQIFFYSVAFVYYLKQKKEISYEVKFFFDIMIIIIVSTALSWHFLIQNLLPGQGASLPLLIVSIGYPFGDLLLLFGAICLYISRPSSLSNRLLALMITGLVIQVFADSAFLYSTIFDTYVSGSLYDPLWSLSVLLVAFASLHALDPQKDLGSTDTYSPSDNQISLRLLLPYFSLMILFVVINAEQQKGITGLILCASLATALLIGRQIFTLRDNRRLVLNYDQLTSSLEHKIEQRTTEVTLKNNQLKKAVQQMKHIAYHDVLTNLPNRRLFLDYLEDSILEAQELQEKVAVVFIDLDRFKNINDTFGHEFGDLLLQGFSERIKQNLRSDDIVSRQGGDEFTLILNNIYDECDISPLIQRLQTALIKPLIVNEHELHISMSIGIALYPNDGQTASELLKHADNAMYSAKAKGKNNFQFFSEDMALVASRKIALENNMRRAITHKEFILYYQPQVNVETGDIIGMEALIRWKNTDGEIISPAEFIPLAEETRLILTMGEWVLYTACEQAKKWHDAGHCHLKLAVNLSPLQFLHEDLMDMVKQTLHKTGFPASSLELEITEGVAVDDAEIAIVRMQELREIGVKIAIDDFGTGYSSLSYLKRFPINNLKIAQPFVQDMATNPSDKALVEAMVFIAHNLNMSVIAEGVETDEQLTLLKQLGCDEIQGYLYSKPLPPDHFEDLLLDELVLEKISRHM